VEKKSVVQMGEPTAATIKLKTRNQQWIVIVFGKLKACMASYQGVSTKCQPSLI
jgi:hypothetical protein